MRVDAILRWLLLDCRSIHADRLAVLVSVTETLIRSGRLTLTALGRALAGHRSHKHSIKRVDRLIGNAKLRDERFDIMARQAHALIGPAKRPVICIDWTGAADGLWALVAAVPVMGRAVPIWFEVYRPHKYANRRVQSRFLERLATLLPDGCCPIIVADSGFKRPFFRALESMQWGFVIRVRGRNRRLGDARLLFRDVLARASECPQELEDCRPGLEARVILSASPAAALRRRRSAPGVYVQQAIEPWLLATNLWRHEPIEIVALYAKRMQIEETFRDTKSHRLGWSFDEAMNRSPARTEVLMLIGALATLVVTFAGLAAERLQLARHFQANTTRTRRVLSVFTLGRLVINNAPSPELWSAWFFALRHAPRLATAAIPPRPNGRIYDYVFVRTRMPF